MPRGLRASRRTVVLVAVILAVLLGLHLTDLSPLPAWTFPPQRPGLRLRPLEDIEPGSPPCRHLASTEDIVVVMRTGATEIQDKLPVHLNTTMRCYPDTLLFSDYAEAFAGREVYDALSIVDDHTKETNADFVHYQRLRVIGREGLGREELHAEVYESGPVGKTENPGWRLDKWKFLPIVARSVELRPTAQWFVFVEPDTFLVWSNVVQWLHTLDPARAAYFGSEVQIGEDVFAHGGSAFVLSAPAMRKVAELYTSDPGEWHTRTAGHWAGDCILGTALAHAGVPFSWAWPLFQGGSPADMDWGEAKEGRRLWCAPALSYHHVAAREVEALWAFEQRHILAMLAERPDAAATVLRGGETVLHHRDVFRGYVMPNLVERRVDWTNMSPDLVEHSARRVATVDVRLEECEAICEARKACVQYAVSPIGCSTSDQVKMGRASEGVRSGWNVERVERWASRMDSCGRRQTGWVET
ncbi:hypothetical protein LTR53_014336 [Teratosphaeriaceae sp. CCFEE 6253]|nr:hypothetical protein LTR53_014336 [Teratosphaeriaceae sp. CCFEE 6253]